MSGTSYVLDTNIVLYMMAGDEWLSDLLYESVLIISVITEMELLSFGSISENQERQVRAFLDDCQIVGLDENIKEQAITVRRANSLKLPDSIIVATALVNDCTLLTADKKLSGIRDLNCFLYQK